jgi:hypothetical protein
MKNEKHEKGHTSVINERLKKLVGLALVSIGSVVLASPAQASVQQGVSIPDRVARVREAIVEKATHQNPYLPADKLNPQVLLAQWGNWNNWVNWYNWDNWNNWHNYWGNTWGNY